MEVNHSQILGIYILVNTRYAKKKKKQIGFLTKMTIPIETGVSFGIETLFCLGSVGLTLI